MSNVRRATSVPEGAYKHLLDAARGRSVTHEDPAAAGVYVERPDHRERRGAPAAARPSVLEEIRLPLVYGSGDAKAMLTGQRGSGKSTELRRLILDPEIAAKYEVIPVDIGEWLDLTSEDVDLRMFLVSIAAVVAQHLALDRFESVRGTLGLDRLAQWVQHLQGFAGLPPIQVLPDLGATLKLGFVELSRRVRDDPAVRGSLRASATFEVTDLRRLVNTLLRAVEQASGRPVLLVVDEGDKIFPQSVADAIFVQGSSTLFSLACAMVLTFPYRLHFESNFGYTARLHSIDYYVVENVKVVTREEPHKVLPHAEAFFRAVVDRLVESQLYDPAIIPVAARYSAGIMREVFRILQKSFAHAHMFGRARVAVVDAMEAVRALGQEYEAATQRAELRERLCAVRRTKRLDTPADWRLLDTLQVVELVNDHPWYDVHGLLERVVDGWIKEDSGAGRLGHGSESKRARSRTQPTKSPAKRVTPRKGAKKGTTSSQDSKRGSARGK